MPECRPQSSAWSTVAAGVRGAICDPVLAGLLLLALLRASDALASDSASIDGPGKAGPKVSPVSTPSVPAPFVGPLYAPPLGLPGTYSIPPLPDVKAFSSKDFRPRGRSVLDTDPHLDAAQGRPASDKNFLERLNEYRSRDRIRVLTLWESGAGAVSIQTDHKGDPSLQWTSRLFNRGGATHGLLDQLFPVSVFTGGHGYGHSAGSQPAKPATSGLGAPTPTAAANP
jgi:hypothetical protein